MTSPAPPSSSRADHIGTDSLGSHRGRRPRLRRWLLAAGVVVLVVVAAVVVVVITKPFGKKASSGAGVTDNASSTSLATVTREDLTSQTQVTATLGDAGSYTVVNQSGDTGQSGSSASSQSGSSASSGTFTALPAVGQVVRQGQVLYQVSGVPVVLLYGSTPVYRSLSEGMTGRDVAELNADLVALGYATRSELDPTSDYFSSATANALEKLQVALGVTETGTLALGQVVFLPTAALVTTVSATLGGLAGSGATVLTATSTTRQVSIALGASQRSEVNVGDKVTITLPDNQTTPGVISSVGTVATTSSSGSSGSGGSSGSSGSSSSNSGSGSSGSGTPTITVLVNPTQPQATGKWDQAPVNVTITTSTVRNVLVVPVAALLSLVSGGYAVEVAGHNGVHQLVAVSLGLFDDADGLVQVTGSGLAAGRHVVVPSS